MIAGVPAVTVACPDCGEVAAVPASRRVCCAGCGTRFDVVAAAEPGEPGGPFRDSDRLEARQTPAPRDDGIEDLSGGSRTRFVRLFARRPRPGLLARLLPPVIVAAVAGGLLALGRFAWAAVDRRPISSTAMVLSFTVPFAVVAFWLAWASWPRGATPIWIEGGRLWWGRRRSRPLAEIESVCLDARDVTHGGTTGKTVTTSWWLAFPDPSGAAERFLALRGLSEEGRTWLTRHLNDGIALARELPPGQEGG